MYERVILWATPAFFVLIAIELVIAWHRGRFGYRAADAINSIALGQLSTYLGHRRITSTQRYLTMIPELLEQASLRFETYTRSEARDA